MVTGGHNGNEYSRCFCCSAVVVAAAVSFAVAKKKKRGRESDEVAFMASWDYAQGRLGMTRPTQDDDLPDHAERSSRVRRLTHDKGEEQKRAPLWKQTCEDLSTATVPLYQSCLYGRSCHLEDGLRYASGHFHVEMPTILDFQPMVSSTQL